MLEQLLQDYAVFISNISERLRSMQATDFEDGVLDRNIYVDTRQVPLESPFIHQNRIHFTETFLNFLWGICFFLCTVTEEYTIVSKMPKGTIPSEMPEHVKKANQIINWALVLREIGLPWPSDIVTPYDDENLVRMTNVIFQNSLAFIFFHEYGHAKLRHSADVTSDISIAQESEADLFSLETVYHELQDEYERIEYMIGVACADIAMLYAVNTPKSLKQKQHQDLDIRMLNHLDFFQLSDSNERRYIHKLIAIGLAGFIDIHKISIDKERTLGKAWDSIQYYLEVIQQRIENT